MRSAFCFSLVLTRLPEKWQQFVAADSLTFGSECLAVGGRKYESVDVRTTNAAKAVNQNCVIGSLLFEERHAESIHTVST